MCVQNDADLNRVFDYSIVFEHAPIGMCISADGVISACNTNAACLFGYTSEELLGQPMSFICCDWREPAFLKVGCNVSSQLVQPASWKKTLRKKNGKTFLCQVTSVVICTGASRTQIWTFAELQHEKSFEEELSAR